MKQKDVLAFILLSLAWGSSFFWVKVILEELGPFTLVALRLLLGAIGLGLVALFTKSAKPSPKEWRTLLLLGVINIAFPFVITTWGQLFIDSGVASILLSTTPLFTVLIAHYVLHDDKVTLLRAIGLLAGFGGVVILLLGDVNANAQSSFWGYVTQLTGAFIYAVGGVVARQNLRNVSVVYQSLIPIAFGDALIWLVTPLVESPIRLPQSTLVWIAILFLGIVSSCIAYLLYYYLLHSIGPTRASMVTYVFPVVGVLLGVLFLNERLDLSLMLGAALVLGSVFVVNRA
jgi:drug/metabolite transporter (DMT)-like permease